MSVFRIALIVAQVRLIAVRKISEICKNPVLPQDIEKIQLQGNAVRRLLELFDRYRGSLVTLDSQLKGISVADRAAFRTALDNLPDPHREAVLDQIAAFTRKTLGELVDDMWSSYILDDPDSAERRFNNTVVDYFTCSGELVDCQQVPGAGQDYGRLRAPTWYSTPPVILLTQWAQESAGRERTFQMPPMVTMP